MKSLLNFAFAKQNNGNWMAVEQKIIQKKTSLKV